MLLLHCINYQLRLAKDPAVSPGPGQYTPKLEWERPNAPSSESNYYFRTAATERRPQPGGEQKRKALQRLESNAEVPIVKPAVQAAASSCNSVANAVAMAWRP